MDKRKKEEFVPRYTYVTLTAERTEKGNAYDKTSDISEYQTVLAVGAHVQDLKPGDKIKFERTAFPASDVFEDPDAEDKIKKLSEETEKRLQKLDASKGSNNDKEIKRQEIRAEFQDKVQDLRKTAKAYAIPVMKDDFGEEFLWVSDRAIMFKFE